MPPDKPPEPLLERRQSELAQKSDSMARDLSQKRELRVRHDRLRQRDAESGESPRPAAQAAGRSASAEGAVADASRTVPTAPPAPVPRAAPPQPVLPLAILDDVASELEELFRDGRSAWRRAHAADRITATAALFTFVGVLLPWLSDSSHAWVLGIAAGGVLHAGLAAAAVALIVGRARVDGRGARLSADALRSRARRASVWHLVLGFLSTVLCGYFLLVYGAQRNSSTHLEIRFGLYVTLAAGMGLSYGGFARFVSRHDTRGG